MDFNAYRQALQDQVAGLECPFPEDELVRRRMAVGSAMQDAGLDALLLTDPSDINYLTGYSTFEVSVHTALVFTPERMVLQVPSIETGPAVACTRVSEILGYRWEDADEVIEPLADALADAGERIGIDAWHGSMRHGVLSGVSARLPERRFADAAAVMDAVRLVKSPAEIACLEESARITGAGIEAASAAVRPGITDSEIAAVGARALHEAGSEFMSMQPIVTAGVRSSIIHTSHRRHVVGAGEPVLLEFGAAWQRYTAPMMRTVIAGSADAQMKRVFDTVRAIYETLLESIRPGRTFDDAAQQAERALAPMAEQVFFSGVFGYAVGAQFPPSWVEGTGYIARGQHRAFERGMAFHLPLCLRIPGRWGIGCSDTVIVTEHGAEPITGNPWTLPEHGA